MSRHKIPILTALLLAAVAAAPAPTPTSIPASQPALSDADLAALITRLGDNDFNTRESAQKDLEKIILADLPRLLKINDTVTDPEIKTRLASRIEPLQDEQALNPPGLTLHLKEVSNVLLAKELSKQLGVNVPNVYSNPSRNGGAFTLDTDQKPFWDIMHDLALQNLAQISIATPDGGSSSMVVPRITDRQGPFVAFVTTVATTKQVNPQASPNLPPVSNRLTIQACIAVDPRLKVFRASSPRLLSIEDDAGNTLFKVANAQPLAVSEGLNRFPMSLASSPNLPDKPGKTLTIKGETLFEIVVSETSVTIDNPDKHLSESITVGNKAFTINNFSIPVNGNGNIGVNLQIKPTPNPSPDLPVVLNGNIVNTPAPSPRIDMKILDANGDSMWTSQVLTGASTNIPNRNGAHPGPYKLIATIPLRTKTILVPFELKNVPMPPP